VPDDHAVRSTRPRRVVLAGLGDLAPALTGTTEIISAALLLGADQIAGWSAEEQALVDRTPLLRMDVEALREAIRAGHDPLGEAFCTVRDAQTRRPLGQTYTPPMIVAAQLDWIADQASPARIIDGGAGSGRYLLAAARRWPSAQLIGSDIDPLTALVCRANLAAAGHANRAQVLVGDYRDLRPGTVRGTTAYPGNPPYVRHHQIAPQWKQWLIREAKARGLRGSALAGLHVHFFLATAAHGEPGDVGSFITAAEWLDTNYGALVRDLLLDGLGGQAVHVLEAASAPFADAAATGAITNFRLGTRPTSLRLRRVGAVKNLGRLAGGRAVSSHRLATATRWSPLTRVTPKLPDGQVELGELCRVHRGTATGANSVWVQAALTAALPARVQKPTITKARELFAAGGRLTEADALRLVVDLPTDLEELGPGDRATVLKWLRRIEKQVSEGYLARQRKAWWSLGLRSPAPILATYMARRPPAFVRNLAGAHHINIAHGLYPRVDLSRAQLDALAAALRDGTTLTQGRTYAGGLVKFEPREMERLPVPAPDMLGT
jgi:adenine-specific DNA-methyltransferase